MQRERSPSFGSQITTQDCVESFRYNLVLAAQYVQSQEYHRLNPHTDKAEEITMPGLLPGSKKLGPDAVLLRKHLMTGTAKIEAAWALKLKAESQDSSTLNRRRHQFT